MEPGKVYPGAEKAAELLPTESGFFFGSTDYDQWYVMGLESTEEQLSKLLEDPQYEHCEFYYHASW
jgi:hypothetical protein